MYMRRAQVWFWPLFLTITAACACRSSKSKSHDDKNSPVASSTKVMTGEELSALDFDVMGETQEALLTQAKGAFDACGAQWAQRRDGNSALYGVVDLKLTATEGDVSIETVGSPRLDRSKKQSDDEMAVGTANCVSKAFDGVQYQLSSPLDFQYVVSYPFCLKLPARCPETVNLPMDKAVEYFSALPENSGTEISLLEELLDSPRLLERFDVISQCRCGVCRVVVATKDLEETNRWLKEIQDRMWAQRDSSGGEYFSFRMISERPMEVPKGLYVHVFLSRKSS